MLPYFKEPLLSELVLEQYEKLQDAMRKCLTLSLERHPKIFGNLHQMDEDFMCWSNVMPEYLVGQFLAACREFTMATYCAASGMYQQAYSGIRFFLELSSASIYYSLYEFERRQWMTDTIDYSWSKGINKDDGMLSPKFVEVFQPILTSHSKEFFEKAHMQPAIKIKGYEIDGIQICMSNGVNQVSLICEMKNKS